MLENWLVLCVYPHIPLSHCFPQMFSDSVTETLVITVKGLEPATQPPPVLETRMLPQRQQDTCQRQEL